MYGIGVSSHPSDLQPISNSTQVGAVMPDGINLGWS